MARFLISFHFLVVLLTTLLTPVDFILAESPDLELVIGMGGDVSLSRTRITETRTDGATYGRFYSWEEMTQGLRSLTQDNDFNFLNMESVVTDQKDLLTDQKFSQRSHPAGLEYLIHKLGFNLISAANNHATDFGQQGLNETYNNLRRIQEKRPLAFHGLGFLDETLTPVIITFKGFKIAFAAIGMKGDGREDRGRPSENKVGMISVRRCSDQTNETAQKACREYSDYKTVLENLKNSDADFRILSIHEGTELAVHVDSRLAPDDSRQKKESRRVIPKFDLAEAYGVDLIIGHHSHNVRPIRLQKQKLALFGLGNFLFLGGQNYMDKPLWNRFGLFIKTYYALSTSPRGEKKFQLTAVEAIPLKNMQVNPSAWGARSGPQFISHLNKISRQNFSDSGVQFKITQEGSGIFCLPGVTQGPRAARLCED